jgi:membrane protein implicated in regulation of membrane protease activity
MSAAEKVHDDLRYVRDALQSADRASSPASIYLLWAAIGAVGFPLADFAPRWVPWFWLVASPLGLVTSLWLGHRQSRREGQLDNREAWRHGLHWLGLLLGAGLAVPLVATGRIDGATIGQVILLLVAIVYFLAGVHLDRALLWVSGLLAVGYLALFVITGWGWTVVGVTMAISLTACALLPRRGRGGGV